MKLLYGGNVIQKELKKQAEINKITIATAFISQYGIDILKEIIENNQLAIENVELYLSYQFAEGNSYEILQQLYSIATVRLVENLHAKVYFIEGKKNLLIYGSANFTYGGLVKNMEFYNIEEDEQAIQNAMSSLNLFFDRCKEKGKLVDIALIEKYKDYEIAKESEIGKNTIKTSSSIIKEIMGVHSTIDNNPRYSEIENFYFTKDDYETFEEYNVNENNANIRNKRKIIQEKLLSINNDIKNELEKYGLYNHWSSEHITSSIAPNQFNNYKVNWIGVRYGRHQSQIEQLNINLTKQDNGRLGFQKYSCMQFSLSLNHFEVGIYHAVANDAVDRMRVREKLLKNDTTFKNQLLEELTKLKGNQLKWHIWSPYAEIDEKTFSIDTENINDFIPFYLKNDVDGTHSSIMFQIEPNNPKMKNKEDIEKLILEKIKLLIPLYKIIIGENEKT